MTIRIRFAHVVVLCVIAVVAVALWPAHAAPGEPGPVVKVGVLDAGRAVSTSEIGRKAIADLKDASNSAQAQLAPAQNELRELQDKIGNAATSAEEKRQLQAMHDEKSAKNRWMADDARQKLGKQSQAAYTDLEQKLKAAVTQVGKEQGYTVILRQAENNPMYMADGVDVTDAVILKLNAVGK